MATTTNFGWTTPDDTALVKDGASAIRTLGSAIDTSMMDLKGGTTGQVLSKNSNTDMDFTWVAQDDSNAIQNAIVDAKGDLISATAADTPARLAVGTDGQVLTADSSQSTGLKWATSSSNPPLLVQQNSTLYVTTQYGSTGTSTKNLAANYTYYSLVFLSGVNFDRIAIKTGSGHTGTSVFRLGIYNASTSTGKPTTVYYDAGTVSATASSTVYTITISQTPPAGWYYLACNRQSATGTPQLASLDAMYGAVRTDIDANAPQLFYQESKNVSTGYTTAGTLLYASDTVITGLRIA